MKSEIFHILTMGAETDPPPCFNNPFDCMPHPLCLAASKEIRIAVMSHNEWHEELQRGKMFGALVVQTEMGIGYLSAFSGQLNGESRVEGFVPPIFDINKSDYFQREMHEIESLTHDKDERKKRSEALQEWLFRQYECMNSLGEKRNIIDIFVDYYKRNTLRQENYLRNASSHHIPSGTGDCCGPKLLQYAFLHGYIPLCMAEFWVQYQPQNERFREVPSLLSEIRHDGQFYPACHKKCRPLLEFMLQGMNVEKSVHETADEQLLEQVKTIYEDEHIVVIDKPSGLLSVPGRDRSISVANWLSDVKHIKEFWFVHRLDQDTSGLLLIAKDEMTYKQLQQQFVRHEVKKTYEAWVDGDISVDEGVITLSMRPDPIDPPRQIVDMEHGKRCLTRWKVIERNEGKTKVELYPETGRTHQLRVHCAHPSGLNAPIIGDKLYGQQVHDDHLKLRARELILRISGDTRIFMTTGI